MGGWLFVLLSEEVPEGRRRRLFVFIRRACSDSKSGRWLAALRETEEEKTKKQNPIEMI